MKVALYLGYFNPFHNGHLESIKSALNDFKMDKVVIVPKMKNEWEDEVTDINKRINIIYASILCGGLVHKGHPRYTCGNSPLGEWVECSPIEKNLIPPYYSYATLHALKNKYCNDEVYILTTENTLEHIPGWMNGEAIIQDYDFLVVDKKLPISSDEIIEDIKLEKDITTLVNPNIIDLIKEYYGKKETLL